jgi:hypothetical protein
LFKHNDSDALLEKSRKLADDYGIEIIYDITVGPLASRRDPEDLKRIIKGISITKNVDEKAYETLKSPLKEIS